MSERTCSTCRSTLAQTPENFRPRSYKGQPRWNTICRACERAYNTSYKSRDGERARQAAYMRQWHKTKRDTSAEYRAKNSSRCSEWHKANRDIARARSAAWYRNKRSTPEGLAEHRQKASHRERNRRIENPSYRMRASLSAHLRFCLRRGGTQKTTRLESMLGYTIADLRRHIERQFVGRMSWTNYGRWHIDHIRPASSFVLVNDDGSPNAVAIRECWALTNLRPLWARTNKIKNNQKTHLL